MLQDVQETNYSLHSQTQQQNTETGQPIPPTTLLGREGGAHMGAGLPPVSARMVTRIEAGEFIDMAELSLDKLGLTKRTLNDDQAEPSKPRHRTVTNILEWTQCFTPYMAVICRKQPERMPDMLGYLILIIEANMEYEGEAWPGYDHRFRQRAASDHSTVWSQSDTTLWDLAFSGKAKANRCCYCTPINPM